MRHLPTSEWIVIILIICTLAFLSIMTFGRNNFYKTNELEANLGPKHFISKEIEVFVTGAVNFPGKHLAFKGATLEEILNMAAPLPDADLSCLKKSSKVRNGQKIYVPSTTNIIIFIEGEVEKCGALVIPRGSYVNDLRQYVSITKDAETRVFNKKRRLRDQETFHVPKRH